MVEFETIPFNAKDGLALNFARLRPEPNTLDRGPVLLIAGTSVRANIFNPPTADTLPRFLSRDGYDVWILNWRASIDIERTRFTLDDGAVLDHPAAVATILRHTGATQLKAVVHCQGSTSFMMAIVSGLLPEVTTVVSNSVALHPHVKTLMWLKTPLVPLLRPFVDELNAQWGLHAPGFWPKVLVWWMRAGHHECNNAVCKMSSFMYGAGFPTLWRHENLNDATHEWIKGEVADAPMSFFVQIQRSVRAGQLVSAGKFPHRLPKNFTGHAPKTDARFVFMSGDMNETFLPTGMAQTFDFFEGYAPGKHTFQKLAGYGHLDVFLGKNAHRDVFPFILDELNRD